MPYQFEKKYYKPENDMNEKIRGWFGIKKKEISGDRSDQNEQIKKESGELEKKRLQQGFVMKRLYSPSPTGEESK